MYEQKRSFFIKRNILSKIDKSPWTHSKSRFKGILMVLLHTFYYYLLLHDCSENVLVKRPFITHCTSAWDTFLEKFGFQLLELRFQSKVWPEKFTKKKFAIFVLCWNHHWCFFFIFIYPNPKQKFETRGVQLWGPRSETRTQWIT